MIRTRFAPAQPSGGNHVVSPSGPPKAALDGREYGEAPSRGFFASISSGAEPTPLSGRVEDAPISVDVGDEAQRNQAAAV